MSQFFGSVWWLIVTMGLLVTFHEFGHFVVARWCGVRVLKFSIGFGPALWSRVDRRGTQFVVAAIPLGGYVKMLDEREMDGDASAHDLEGAHNRQPVGNRMAISAAGPVFNLLFTVFAFWLMFVIGKPDYLPVVGHADHLAASAGFQNGDRITAIGGQPVDTWTDASIALLQAGIDRRDTRVTVVDAGGTERTRQLALSKLPADLDEENAYREIGLAPRQWALPAVVGLVQPDSAAARAGLLPGDRIVSIEGEAVSDWRDVPEAIQKHADAGRALRLGVARGADALTLSATPVRNPDAGRPGAPAWVLGISPQQPPEVGYDTTLHYGPLAAIPKALGETWQRTRETVGMLWRMLTGAASLKNLSSVITIAQAANSSAQLGPAWFLNFLAIISLSLAILNLLPIPILDGGHLVYYLIELIKGSPVSDRMQVAGQYVGLTLLMALMGLAFYNDILRIAS
jgi:regulator of sigma E protease